VTGLAERYCCGDGPEDCTWDGHGYHCRGGVWGGCGPSFHSAGAFAHHRKSLVCQEPAAIGMVQTANGTWGRPGRTDGQGWPEKLTRTGKEAPKGSGATQGPHAAQAGQMSLQMNETAGDALTPAVVTEGSCSAEPSR